MQGDGVAAIVMGVAPSALFIWALALLGMVGFPLFVDVPSADADSGGSIEVGSEVPATAMNRTVRPGNNTPQIAAHPHDRELMALANRLDAPDFSCALHISGDGGDSWTPVTPVPDLPDGVDKCYGPEIAFGPEGTLYFLFVGLAGEGNRPMGVYLTESENLGRSFSESQQILGKHKFGVRMAMDRKAGEYGRLHVAWIDARAEPATGGFAAPPNPIMAAHSDDGGETLSEPVKVSESGRDRVVGPALAVGPGGMVYVGYYDLRDDARDYRGMEGPVWDGTWELVLATSTDGGESFGTEKVVDGGVTPHERIMVVFSTPPPALAVGEHERLCMAWPDARYGDADVLARCTKPGREEWFDPVRVNDDERDNGVTQNLPQIAVAPNGRIDTVFYDQRRSPKDAHKDVFFSYSTDGGRTFSGNTRLTSEASFGLIGQQYAIPSAEGMVEFGDRLALYSDHDGAIAGWADTRNSRPPSRAQDIFTVTLRGLPTASATSEEDGRPDMVAAGAAIVIVAVTLVALARRRHGGRKRSVGGLSSGAGAGS